MNLHEYCSWCHGKAKHELVEINRLSRHIYRCASCGRRTLKCRYCSHMARGSVEPPEGATRLEILRGSWDDELCAEHDGSIASFERLDMRLDDLEDFSELLRRDQVNIAQAGKIVVGAVGAAAVVAPFAVVAAPALASALGAAGVLGAAGTGTAIGSLSGAALSSASLAAIGGGTMAGGTVVITAAGAALGGARGGVVTNGYLGQIRSFDIMKQREGEGPAVICVNGFLTESEPDTRDWRAALRKFFPKQPWYYLQWESKTLREIGNVLTGATSARVVEGWAVELAKKASKSATSKLGMLSAIADFVGNPWHTAMLKAEMTGVVLADLLARTKHPEGFVLMGHSLGARVIHYALMALSTKSTRPIVRDAYLFGGAVGSDEKSWREAESAVRGRIYNFHSDRDQVLNVLYRASTVNLSDPIGRSPIKGKHQKIVNVNVSRYVAGHTDFKPKLLEIMPLIDGEPPAEEGTNELEDVECPYCRAELEVDATSGIAEDFECGACGETFVYGA